MGKETQQHNQGLEEMAKRSSRAREEQRLSAGERVNRAFKWLSDARGTLSRQTRTMDLLTEHYRSACHDADSQFDPLIKEKQQQLLQIETEHQQLTMEIETLTLQIKTRKEHLSMAKTRLSEFHKRLSADKGLYIPTDIPAQELRGYLECTHAKMTAAIDRVYENQSRGNAYFGFNRHNVHQHWLYYTTFFQATEAEEDLFDLLVCFKEKLKWIDYELTSFESGEALEQDTHEGELATEKHQATSFLPERNLWTMKADEGPLLKRKEALHKIHTTTLKENQALQQAKDLVLEPSQRSIEGMAKRLLQSQYTVQLAYCEHQQAQLALTILKIEWGLVQLAEKTDASLTWFQELKTKEPNEAFQCFLNKTPSDVSAGINATALITSRPSFHDLSLSELAAALEQERIKQTTNLRDLIDSCRKAAPDPQLNGFQDNLLAEFECLQEKALRLTALNNEKVQQLHAMSDVMRLMKQRQDIETVLTRLANDERTREPALLVAELQPLLTATINLLGEMEKRSDPTVVCHSKQLRQAATLIESQLERYQSADDLLQLTRQQQSIAQTLHIVSKEAVVESNPSARMRELNALSLNTAAVLEATKGNQNRDVASKRLQLDTLLSQLKPHMMRYEEENDRREAWDLLQDCNALIGRFNQHGNRAGLYEAYEAFFGNGRLEPLLHRLKSRPRTPLVEDLVSRVSAMALQRDILAPETLSERLFFGEAPPSSSLMPARREPVNLSGEKGINCDLQPLDNYLLERSQTYYVKDKISEWTCSWFARTGCRSDKERRTRYIFDLKSEFDLYQKEPTPANYQSLIDCLDQGITNFSPRASAGKGYEKSLRAQLETLKRQLPVAAPPDLEPTALNQSGLKG
ncbi:hypothetical protein DIZ81_02285 [Legionella taurinensis]|uniref:Uncharacterized protein n=1 Tax=Legionella taurinensis TaxID=70611 RepID=A0AB38N6Z0_9GAMM|nr:hypothetical protein [Legionella taurinensis]MDX1836299.1 hypothetical protein [Legionella taurinensis]PUT41945.1 hypothetical protein DB744_02290 [Legionella taurinensis]PUT44734.1 hypothetical protein DB746_02290 [Legionella taurinensis]PUT48054.1 hypothetical protein DB743_00450 [Legionella taurinensis]PUT48869.1 hypothetical protein DB745_02290 [Legionella taurinensis]